MANICSMCPTPSRERECDYKPHPTKVCSGCENSKYCSLAHQKDDWKIHSTVCENFGKMKERPSPEMRRVLYFPVDDPEPEFRWLPVKSNQSAREEPAWEEKELFENHSSVDRCEPKCGRAWHMKSCYKIHLANLKPNLQDNLEPNECIYNLTDGDVSSWKGPMFAYGIKVESPESCVDLDTTDLKPIVDFITRRMIHQEDRNVQAVIINCDGHVAQFGSRRCKSVSVRKSQPSHHLRRNFKIPICSQISKIFGTTLHTYQWHTDPDLDARTPMASLLHIGCSKNSHQAWGYYSKKRWGNIIVLREDGQPLDPAWLEGFCTWIDKDLRPLFNTARKQMSQMLKKAGGQVLSTDEGRQYDRIMDDMISKVSKKRFLGYNAQMDDVTTDEEMPDDLSWDDDEE